jgi:hypothetical protein
LCAAGGRSFGGDDLAVDVLLLKQQRPFADVSPLERERLLGPRASVGEQGNERGISVALVLE